MRALTRQLLKDPPREVLHLVEDRFQPAVFSGGPLIDRCGFFAEAAIDGFAVSFAGPLVVRTVAAGRPGVATAPRLPALHHAREHRAF